MYIRQSRYGNRTWYAVDLLVRAICVYSSLPVQKPNLAVASMHFLATLVLPVQEAWDWVASLDHVDAVRFHLASSFPRKVFTDQEQRNSLVELGLAPQAALFVQLADDE